MKQFLVIGLGNFGSMVARELAKLDCKVTAVDVDKAKVMALQDQAHIVSVLADSTDRKFLEQLSVGQFEAIIASTGKDSHASILIALHLKELGAQNIIVKANSADHAKILMKVGATDVVIPERQMAVKLAHSLAQPNVIDYLPLGQAYNVAELSPPEQFIGKKLQDLQLRAKYKIQVIAVKDSHSDEINFVLDGNFKIKNQHILVVLGHEKDINRLREKD